MGKWSQALLAGAFCISLATAAEAQVGIVAPDRQIYPATATGGNEYLVVWEDHRTGLDWRIHGAFVWPSGLVDASLVISGPGSAVSGPSVGYRQTGASFLVVWAHKSDVVARRVSDTGMMGGIFVVAGGAGTQGNPVVACEASDCTVAYVDNGSGSHQVFARRVSSTDAVDPAVPLSGFGPSPIALQPRIAVGGSTYYVAWQTEFGTASDPASGVRVKNTPGGLVVLDVPPVPLSAPSGEADRPSAVATDGKDFLVTWTRGPSSAPFALYGRLVSGLTGLPLAPEFKIAGGGDVSFRSGVVFSGTNYLVTWQDPTVDRVLGRRVSAGGTLVDPAPLALSDPATVTDFNTAATRGFGFTLLAWDDRRNPTEDIFLKLLPGAF